MSLLVRPMRPEEAQTFLDIHTRAIRGLAAPFYPPEVLASWVVPITEEKVQGFLKNPDEEIRLLAELDGVPVGLGCLVVAKSELRACYVVPEAARQGVGSALVSAMESLARENGLSHLHLDSSINAEAFYASLGYDVVSRIDRMLRSGVRMAAVQMRKALI